MSVKQLLKDWTLPVSMLAGTAGYLLFTQVAALHAAKTVLVAFIPYLLPLLIFIMPHVAEHLQQLADLAASEETRERGY